MIDLKNISFRSCTVHSPSLLFKSSREGGNITHFAKLLSKIDRDVNFFATFLINGQFNGNLNIEKLTSSSALKTNPIHQFKK